jgi:hypothetical protein
LNKQASTLTATFGAKFLKTLPIMSKRPFEGKQEIRPNPTRISSDASRFNDMLLKKLQKALHKDPEANLIDLFPLNYASRLAEKKKKRSGKISGCLFSPTNVLRFNMCL